MREAVTAIFVHDDDIFIIKRQDYLRAFPGYYAFPGGKIDEEDRSYLYDHPLLCGFPGQQIRALIRELNEELGYDLEQAIVDGQVMDIVRFGTAVTPAFEHYRFSAHYFKIILHQKPVLKTDSQEISWSDWIHKDALWHRYHQGNALMVIPTMHTVRALAENITAEKATPFNFEYNPERELPYLELIAGLGYIPIPSRTLPPARFTNALVLGGEGHPRYLVDPSPKSDQLFELLLNNLQQHPIDGVVVTHHHPDHHERAPELARHLDLPLLCTEKTAIRLEGDCGSDYLQEIDLIHLKEGTRLTTWLGRSVYCHELPGHDDGMIGLAPEDMSWFFVSDLVQQTGTVVIPEPEGDMQAYFNSLERVIAMEPDVIIPSHGMPMGGTHILKQTLKHRQEREEQIRSLYEQGMDRDAMLNIIYQGLDEKLLPLAQQNIRQHMRKLGLVPLQCDIGEELDIE